MPTSFNFSAAKKDHAQEFFMPDDAQAELADLLNRAINIPGLNEQQERQVILKVVQSLDRNTFKFVPKELLDAALNHGEGLPQAVIDSLREALPMILADAIPLPFVPPIVKQAILGLFINQLLTALHAGNSLAKKPK